MPRKIILPIFIFLFSITSLFGQQQVDTSVKEIIVVFKTHFDTGYTDFAEAVSQKYSTTMMEQWLSLIERSKTQPKEKQFVWTVSGWPMEQMLQHSLPDIQSKVKQSVKDGRFAVHALPFSIQTESADLEHWFGV